MLLPTMWPRPAATPSGLPERSSVTGTTWRWVTSQWCCFCMLCWTKTCVCFRCLTECLKLIHQSKDTLGKRRATLFQRSREAHRDRQCSCSTDLTLCSPLIQASIAHGIWKVTFYTPEAVSLLQREAEQAGYRPMISSKRLVMRSPYNTPETYSEDVSEACSSRIFVLLQLVK